ncbi:MAG: NAD(P)/FAD-dependent oxidoreductase [Syntrophobacteraceae bacterium]
MKRDVIVIGAGASGLICAAEAGKRGRSVLVLDHADRICGKIRVSGGGRCNFTNRHVSRENYLSSNPNFCTSALSRFTPDDFISRIQEHGIRYHEEGAGRLFCDGSSMDIVDMLKTECDTVSVTFLLSTTILEITKATEFRVSTGQGVFSSESLVIATGGLSFPSLRSSNFGYTTARRFGLKVTPLRPALAPIRFSREDCDRFSGLAGISTYSIVQCGGAAFCDDLLFTHRGLSGPAILQISSYWDRESSIAINLLPGIDLHGILMEKRNSRIHLLTFLDKYLPRRLLMKWSEFHPLSKPLNQYSPHELESICRSLHNWHVKPSATEGFERAEVTLGGVDTNGLSSKTMESKGVPGLYFLGEVADVTGQLGGYNLHWAWASGYAAGQYV